MFTCNKCGGYSESRICPSCRRNENLAEDLDDNQRRLQRESVWEQERLQRESIWEQQKLVEQQQALQLQSIQEQERLQQESIEAQKELQKSAHVNSIRAKMLDLSLLALSDEKKAKESAKILFKSRSFNEFSSQLGAEVISSEFLSDCYFELHFREYDNYGEHLSDSWRITFGSKKYSEHRNLIGDIENPIILININDLYDKLCCDFFAEEFYLDYEIRESFLRWVKKNNNIFGADSEVLVSRVFDFRDKLCKIWDAEQVLKFREEEALHQQQIQNQQLITPRKGAMRAKGSRHPDNVRSIIESLIFIAAGYVTFSYNSHSVYNLMGVDFSRAPVPVLASIVIAFLVCTLFFKNFSRQNPLPSRYNKIGIYYLWLGSSLTIFLLVFWKELSPNYRLATMGAILIAPAIPKINALLSAICRASILGFIAFFVSKILGCIALIVFGYIVNLANR